MSMKSVGNVEYMSVSCAYTICYKVTIIGMIGNYSTIDDAGILAQGG